MKQTNGQRGASFERYCIKKFLSDPTFNCNYAMRSAGSHGPIDFMLMGDNIIYAVQAKKYQISSNEAKRLIDSMRGILRLRDTVVKYMVVSKTRDNKITIAIDL